MIPNDASESTYLQTQFSNSQGIVIAMGPEIGYKKINAPLNVSVAETRVFLAAASSTLIHKNLRILTSHGKNQTN